MEYNMLTHYPDGTTGYEMVEIPDDAFTRKPPPRQYTPLELTQQTITDLDLELIQMGQEMTDMELTMYEMVKISGGGGTLSPV